MYKFFCAALFSLVFVLGADSKSFAQSGEFSDVKIDSRALDSLAIQDGGRIKPFDTFARESVQLLTGKTRFRDKSPTQIVLSWLIIPEKWNEDKFVEVNYHELKKDLGLSETEKYFSPIELAHNPKLAELFTKLGGKKPSPYMQRVGRIANQLGLYNSIVSGQALRFVPNPQSNDWFTMNDAPAEFQEGFKNVSFAFLQSIKDKNGNALDEAAAQFKLSARAMAPDKYPKDSELNLELWFNDFHPFRQSWILYLVGAILLAFNAMKHRRALVGLGVSAVVVGFILNVVGFIVRSLIADRPPVTNMYETVAWVAFGAVFFGLIFAAIYKKARILLSAAVIGTIAMVVADSIPAVLDASIKPLEPVLRSNLWLIIHVMTITLSYAAFALALGISNYALGYSVFNRAKAVAQQQILGLYVYRIIQVGVVLLAAGTILGGVWADYSWGRFWGWDPKETWALIALLCYLAVLHGRLVGWVNMHRLHVCSVVCFTAVIMAWYGVNFVLGVGLHSYGFGAGGVQYMAAIVGIQLAFVAFASWKHPKGTVSQG